MLYAALLIGFGVIVGWQFPQPEIAKKAQAAVIAWLDKQWDKYFH
jgi:predicted negative regulator of RcsB-dependent stress response